MISKLGHNLWIVCSISYENDKIIWVFNCNGFIVEIFIASTTALEYARTSPPAPSLIPPK